MTEQAAVASQASLARLAAVLLAAFHLPPLLIAFGYIPLAYRFVVLLGVAAALAILAWQQGLSARELGLRTDNLRPALGVNAALSVAVGSVLLTVHWLGFMRQPRAVDWWWFAPFYVLVSCPAQEFACRGFLFAEMNRRGITGSVARIAVSAVTYAFLHVVYRDALAFLAPLCIGVAWGAIYQRHPNLWGVVLSHAVLGLISIAIGLV
jgi:CAAX protease family protein